MAHGKAETLEYILDMQRALLELATNAGLKRVADAIDVVIVYALAEGTKGSANRKATKQRVNPSLD